MSSSFGEWAMTIREAEAPLWEQYESLAATAGTDVERELARHLADSQRFQLSFLELMASPLPSRVHCFAKVAEDEVKLRQGPGPGYPVIRELSSGMPCLVVETDGFWANLQLPDGTRGWAFKEYVHCERALGEAGASNAGSPGHDEPLPFLREPAAQGGILRRRRV